MKDKFFDHIIKDKLNTIHSPTTEGSWELFQQKMDVADLEEDLLLDKKISDEISRFTIPYNPSHWAQLKEKLELESFLKTRVYIAKVAEITMLFLLLFTLYNIYPTSSHWFDGKQEQLYAQDIRDDISSESIASIVIIPEEVSEQFKAVENVQEINETDILSTPITYISATEIKKFNSGPVINKLNMPVIDPAAIKEGYALELISESSSDIGEVAKTELASPAHIAALQSPLEVNNMVSMDMMVNSPIEIQKNVKGRHAWNLGVGADINLINVPWDEVYSLPGYNLDETSVSGFAGVDFTLNNEVQLRTGLGYKRNSYEPRKVNEKYGSSEEYYIETSLDRITYDIVSVPLALNLSLFKSNGWKSYLSLGAALNIITKTDYLITETLRSDISRPNAYPRSAPKLEEKEFVLGIAEGGDISKNLYATASFGLGLEKRVSNGLSVYMQPTYNHHILNDAVGPNEDKLNSMSLQLGLKFDIN